ncbi:MAG: hypothetical protein FWH48_04920, partial [Oscillospiraceae bacterium]|nr:hypothetical protein [Oscillospiraceae bacterium]
TCLRCEETKTEAIPVDGHEHSYTSVVTAPTCEEQGYTTHTCSVCGDSYEDDYVDALGHDYVAVVTDPTCEDDGYTTYTCSVCGDTYVADETNALGHDYVGVETTSATCEEEGLMTYTCSRCGEIYTEVINALGHDWDDGEVTTPPTETEEGERTFTCRRCGETKTEPIAKLVDNNKITVNGVEIDVKIENGTAVLDITPEQMDDIIKDIGKDEIVFDFTGLSTVDISVDAACFKDIDAVIVIKTDAGDVSVKTKTLWNNSGKERVITVKNGKVDVKNK